MKVTFLTWEYPPCVYGGAGIHVQNLVANLKEQVKIEVRALLPEGDEVPEAENEDGIDVFRFPSWSFVKSTSSYSSVLSAFAADLAMVKNPISGDIVHVHTWYAALAGYYAKRLYDQRLVMTVHSLEPRRPWKGETLGKGYLLSTWAERTCLEACDRVIAVSHADANDVVECYDVSKEKIRVVPNGVDVTSFRKREDSGVLAKYDVEKPYVLFIGRLSRQKGIFDLVSAAKRLPRNVTTVLVTGVPDEPGLTEELSTQLEGRSDILWINKMLSRAEVVALLSGSAIFVSPSIYEPFGIMNLEAMACSRPVVSTRVGGIVDVIVDGETGILVPPRDPEAIGEAINVFLSNLELSERMGKAGRERVETYFTWRKVADETFSIYREMLE